MTTATITSPRHAEIVDILKSASKGMTSREIFAKAKGFEDADEVSKALNYMLKKGQVEREKVAQNTYCYWLTSSKASDIGNTLLRIGEDDPMPASPVRAVINDALKPCPEIDAVTQEMANQAEIAYQVLSEALGTLPEEVGTLTLSELAETAAARLQLHQASSRGYANFKATICNTLDLNTAASSMEILAEVENISRLADRATHTPAPSGPYIIISDPRGAAGTYETIDEARPFAESTARRSTFGRSAIVSVVAEVGLVPQWSDA